MNTENNKIIAEFMGFEQYPIQNKSNGYIINFNDGNVPYKLCAGSLEFHSDWNWLMEVVEKIEKIQRSKWSKNTYPCISISAISCKISFYGNTEEIISNIIRPSKKQAIYDACVEFIKWYNKKKLILNNNRNENN